MKSRFAKFQNSEDALETALRESAPKSEFPDALHGSIIGAIHMARRHRHHHLARMHFVRRILATHWLRAPALASLVLAGVWFVAHRGPQKVSSTAGPLAEFSTAFAASRELVDAAPSEAVRPLADELNNVNRDLDRTAKFLLANLP